MEDGTWWKFNFKSVFLFLLSSQWTKSSAETCPTRPALTLPRQLTVSRSSASAQVCRPLDVLGSKPRLCCWTGSWSGLRSHKRLGRRRRGLWKRRTDGDHQPRRTRGPVFVSTDVIYNLLKWVTNKKKEREKNHVFNHKVWNQTLESHRRNWGAVAPSLCPPPWPPTPHPPPHPTSL